MSGWFWLWTIGGACAFAYCFHCLARFAGGWRRLWELVR